MTRGPRCRYDEDDDYDRFDRPIRKKTGNNTLLWVLLGGGAALVLLVCLLVVCILVVMSMSNGSQPDEFVGTWRGRWTIVGRTFDSLYTFNKDGTFREQSFDLQGRPLNDTAGRWRFRNGQIEITWLNGGFENATVTRVDGRTINYHIVSHTQAAQIGLTTTLRRQ